MLAMLFVNMVIVGHYVYSCIQVPEGVFGGLGINTADDCQGLVVL